MEQLPDMDQSTGGAVLRKPPGQFNTNVLLLKNGNFQRIDGQFYMPTESEISTIKRSTQLGQFRRRVEFCASMSEDEVKKKLQETFPYLENACFVCAAVVKLDKEHKRFEFHGLPRLWNGKTIKESLKGNSALYILEDEVPGSETELNATETPRGDDDVVSSIATNVNQISLLDDSQMEIEENHQEPSRDQSVTVRHLIQAQMSYSSEEGTSFVDSASTSGIEGEFSEEDVTLLRWAENNFHYEIGINPTESPLKGGAPCCFTFNPKLQPDVTSGRATFENLGVVQLERSTNGSLFGTNIPASPVPGWVPIIVESQDDIQLGQTGIYYEDPVEGILEQLVFDPTLQRRLFDKYNTFMRLGSNLQTSGAGAQQSETLGLKEPVEMLSLLVYEAAESGAQEFIDLIFTSSAGRIVFDTYKDSSRLPEAIAKDHGNELTAHYLEVVTKRFSNERRTGKECPQTIDWSELVKAAEEAQNRLHLTNEEEEGLDKQSGPKETGCLENAHSSSSAASAPQSSNSEDDISTRTKSTAIAATTTTITATRKGSIDARECQIGLQKHLHGEGHNTEIGDPIACNYRSHKEKLHQFESKSGNRHSEDPIAGNCRGRKETLHQFASLVPAVVNFKVTSRGRIIFKKTQVTHGANLQQIVSCPSALKKFCEDHMSGNPSGNISGNSGAETGSRTLGCKTPAQVLSLLVYVAAKIGAQQFIEIILTSSARRLVHNAYKRNLTLPETIAKDHGYIETANYLADVTKRFSEETTTDNECSQTIDWSELVKAAEAAEKQLDPTGKKEDDEIQKDIPKETDYLGDIDSSSSESSEAQSSDSDDDISRTSRKVTLITKPVESRKQSHWFQGPLDKKNG